MTPEQQRALYTLRTSPVGRLVKYELRNKLAQARETYENNPASETQRQVVLAYRETLKILFGEEAR